MTEAVTAEQAQTTYPYPYVLETSGLTINLVRAKVAPIRFRLAAKPIVKELNIQSGDQVLEVGSGLGLLGKQIKKRVGAHIDYVGLDLMFKPLTENKGTILPIQANILSLPFRDASFDKLISTDVLEHIPDAQKAVQELYRVLKPGGRAFLVIADPSEGRFTSVSGHIKRAKSRSDVSWWENLFQENGFQVLTKASRKYRLKDWRRIFNLPFLVKFKNRPGFACAFNPVNRPGTYVLLKP